ncbi:peptidyl-prolyl cis-trans isomerase [Paenibacillus antarcticus]|uniref:PpiC domain-containing protein n=1 Tax=Paenibacillus antarcticus TaxID=253703 RepID=A0A168MMQ4_9BACL|nr:peptidylprolyl isomerase [Paenibacillus antarcticus]OAB44852.1 hypothetical protein PBAT_14815 [Paenibacillus antarcticus]
MKRVLLLFVSIVALASVVTAVFLISRDKSGIKDDTSSDVIARINGITVEASELKLILQLSGVRGGDNDIMKAEAMENLIMVKTAQQAAIDYGIMKDSSYTAFLKELNNENNRRAKALENKQVIYGPKEYSEQTYYDYRNASIINQLKSAWVTQELKITEKSLLDYYMKNRELLARKHDKMMVYKLVEPINENRQEAENRIREIQQRVKNESAFFNEFDYNSSTTGLTEFEIIDENNYKEISKYRSGYYSLITGLAEGEISRVIEENNSFLIAMVSDREKAGYKAFDEVREEVIQQYKDHSFETYIKQLASQSVIEFTEEE